MRLALAVDCLVVFRVASRGGIRKKTGGTSSVNAHSVFLVGYVVDFLLARFAVLDEAEFGKRDFGEELQNEPTAIPVMSGSQYSVF